MINEPKARQFIVNLDVEAKKYSEWLNENVDAFTVLPQDNILDIFDKNQYQDSRWEEKIKGIRNKLLRSNPSADQFMLGIMFMTCVFRHQHQSATVELEEQQWLSHLELCTENLERIRDIFSTLESTIHQKELLIQIKEAIQLGRSAHESPISPHASDLELKLRERLSSVMAYFDYEEKRLL